MKLSTFMSIVAIFAFVFGLSYLFAPVQANLPFGITLDNTAQWVCRYLGGAYIGIAILVWFARKVEEGEALRAILLGGFIMSAIGIVLATLDSLYGGGNAFVWSFVAVYILLTLGFGYFRFVRCLGAWRPNFKEE